MSDSTDLYGIIDDLRVGQRVRVTLQRRSSAEGLVGWQQKETEVTLGEKKQELLSWRGQ